MKHMSYCRDKKEVIKMSRNLTEFRGLLFIHRFILYVFIIFHNYAVRKWIGSSRKCYNIQNVWVSSIIRLKEKSDLVGYVYTHDVTC